MNSEWLIQRRRTFRFRIGSSQPGFPRPSQVDQLLRAFGAFKDVQIADIRKVQRLRRHDNFPECFVIQTSDALRVREILQHMLLHPAEKKAVILVVAREVAMILHGVLSWGSCLYAGFL